MDEKYLALKEAIADGDGELGIVETKKLIDQGLGPATIFSEGIQTILNELGEQFSRMEIFLPELMIASEAVKDIQNEITPLLKGGEAVKTKGKVVIGTVYGDLHDIGKNMVSLMMQVNGFEVQDLGVSVETSTFLKSAKDFNADIIMLSGLMLPSLPYMKDTIDQVKENPSLKDKYKIMVGGGPVTETWAMSAGADGYSDDAIEAVAKAIELMGLQC